MYVAANLFPISGAAPLGRRPISIFRLPGGALEAPAGRFLFAFPKGIVDLTGSYHLFWAEPDTLTHDPARWPASRLTSLWHSVFDGKAWSPPERILSGRSVYWAAEGGVAVVDAANRVHVVVPARPATGPGYHPVVHHLRRVDGRWEQRESATSAVYASIAAWGRDSLLVAYVAADTGAQSDRNSVFSMASPDGGSSWGAPVLLSRSGSHAATSPVLIQLDDGMLHLVWLQRLPGGAASKSLRHWRSPNRGRSWERLADAPLPVAGEVIGFNAAADRCGTVQALVESFDGGRLLLHEIRWAGQRVEAGRLFPDFEMVGNAAIIAEENSVRVVGSAVRRSGDHAFTFTATREPCAPGEKRETARTRRVGMPAVRR